MVAVAEEPVLRLDRLTKHYRLRRTSLREQPRVVHALDDITLSLGAARTLGVVGESGCGKSTLGRLITGLTQPTSGQVVVAGAGGNARPQMVFQDPAGALDPRMSVAASIAEALPGLARAARASRVRDVLDTVRLSSSLAQRRPHELSGGQQQRVCIARALAGRPPLIVLDEAVSALDASLQSQVLRLLVDVQQAQRVTYVFISHDLRAVRALSDDIAVMYLGQVVESAPAQDYDEGLLHPYSVALRSAEPELEAAAGRASHRVVLGGEPPSAVNPPPACRFAARCPIAQQICREQPPQLLEVAPRHRVACHFPGEFKPPGSPARRQPDIAP